MISLLLSLALIPQSAPPQTLLNIRKQHIRKVEQTDTASHHQPQVKVIAKTIIMDQNGKMKEIDFSPSLSGKGVPDMKEIRRQLANVMGDVKILKGLEGMDFLQNPSEMKIQIELESDDRDKDCSTQNCSSKVGHHGVCVQKLPEMYFHTGLSDMGGRYGENKTVVSSCQDCHMPDLTGEAAAPCPERIDEHHGMEGMHWDNDGEEDLFEEAMGCFDDIFEETMGRLDDMEDRLDYIESMLEKLLEK